jgi:hypothetical protein
VLSLNREKFWCSKEGWTHLLDNCSLWQPRQYEPCQNLPKNNCDQ